MAKCFGGIIDHARIKSIMPQNERTKELQKYKNPVLVMAAQMDCLFPAKGILCRAKKSVAARSLLFTAEQRTYQ